MNLPTVDPIALESDYWLAQWRQGTHSYIMCANRLRICLDSGNRQHYPR